MVTVILPMKVEDIMVNKMKFNTSLLHGNIESEKRSGATITPIYQSSAFEQESAEKLEKIFLNIAPGFSYTRINNPTIESFEQRISLLEGGVSTVACASGMAAIFNAMMNVLKSGDEIISSAAIFGGTIGLFKDLDAFGIRTVYVKEVTVEEIEKNVNENTKIIFAETIGNPKLDVLDIQAIAKFSKERNILFIVDNTVSTAYLVKPIELGANVVINSSSKYINGSGNSISGVITDSGKFAWKEERYPGIAPYKKMGPFAYTAKLRETLFRNTGACLSPFNAYLTSLGLETMGLRMERACDNAFKLAKWFEREDKLVSVNYPGLESSPYHDIAKKQFVNGYGAMVTIRAGSKEKAFSIINHLKYALKVSNIGDTKTLVIHPASTIYSHSTTQEKLNAGVYEDLIRISVGIENIEDLIADFEQAIKESNL